MERLEHEPEQLATDRTRLGSSSPDVSTPSIQYEPVDGTSSSPNRLSSVDFPEPDAPVTVMNSPP
jgi:hypothetical protein